MYFKSLRWNIIETTEMKYIFNRLDGYFENAFYSAITHGFKLVEIRLKVDFIEYASGDLTIS